MKLKRRWHRLSSTERVLLVFIIVGLLAYAAFWVAYLLGYLPYLDQPKPALL